MQKETELVGEAEPLRSDWISLAFSEENVFISGKTEITNYKSIVPGRIQLASNDGTVTQNVVSFCTSTLPLVG